MRPWPMGGNSGRRPSSALCTRLTGSGRFTGVFQLACDFRRHASRMLLPMARRSARGRRCAGILAGAAPAGPSRFLLVIESSCRGRRTACFAPIQFQFPTQSRTSGARERRRYSKSLVPLNRHHRLLLGNLGTMPRSEDGRSATVEAAPDAPLFEGRLM